MNRQTLLTTATAMVAKGKGILAMDESTGTCHKRFKKAGIEETIDQRQAYRDLLVTTPGLSSHISGAILYDETIRQNTLSGVPFAQFIEKQGILPGIKVDAGAKDLAGHPGEKVTEGLDGLRERFVEYKKMGARFAKWRAVITIGPGIPSHACIQANAHALARYAALAQEADLVPIVEPEVLIDGDHTLERCYEVTRATLRRVFSELAGQGVAFEGMILKASMVISGKSCPKQAGVEDVARETVRCLLNTVPPAVAGIAFLSGGQGTQQATAHLNAMNRMKLTLPWPLSFSYARALQQPTLEAWAGKKENVAQAQKLLLRRAKFNGAATLGLYREEMEKEAA
ncbi:MAG TPA: class I fructose-bisphosphate aldolase [Sulfuricaulis sp.]|nr:fructose-bisphosphate aldolase class I [Gammaproteobacteria bacterium]HEU5339300.1 class I fructose-bisphosphate aldolase [Sulfuricaulis sp.]MDH3370440.1 fructose-bisphosphate aldolase class I [Gammaproteobacteria bacterium]MDH3405562.1 fructose-bisphosphate aldolase class I [Gammaproteobacteria bacterium]MDH3562037.1 fructose-bisphosphate aldolase class I [Gammaproteobacteria bacterium]